MNTSLCQRERQAFEQQLEKVLGIINYRLGKNDDRTQQRRPAGN
jgi:hypothetical protein